MLKKILITIFIIILYIIIPTEINKPKRIINNIKTEVKENIGNPIKIEKPVGTIKIPSINLKKDLYEIDSTLNNIEENVTILKNSKFPSLIIIAAHSGTGKNAFFKDLDKINMNDIIKIEYEQNNYTFIVTNIYEQNKTGYIDINKSEENQLFLTTCSKDNSKQLIIECIQK